MNVNSLFDTIVGSIKPAIYDPQNHRCKLGTNDK